MNNFELHERAQEYADTLSPYELARRLVEAEERLRKLQDEEETRG